MDDIPNFDVEGMEVTVSDILDSIAKNGLPQIKNRFFTGKNGRFISQKHPKQEVGAACALGQAAYNLNADIGSLQDALNYIKIDPVKMQASWAGYFPTPCPFSLDNYFPESVHPPLSTVIVSMNDVYNVSFETIAAVCRGALTKTQLNTKVHFYRFRYVK